MRHDLGLNGGHPGIRGFDIPATGLVTPRGFEETVSWFCAPCTPGEGHRLLHELLEVIRLALPADWSVTAQLVLDAAAKRARWCRDASKAVVERPASCKAMVESSSEHTRSGEARSAETHAAQVSDVSGRSPFDLTCAISWSRPPALPRRTAAAFAAWLLGLRLEVAIDGLVPRDVLVHHQHHPAICSQFR